MAIYVTESEVTPLLTMRGAIQAVEEMFRSWGRGGVVNHTRRRIRIPAGYFMTMDGADLGKGAGLKVYTATGPRTNMLVHLYSSQTGELLAIIEGNRLGAVRTGATSGIATQHMASTHASTLGIIGSGRQAETQAAGVCAVRPIQHVRVFSRHSDRRDAFAEKMAEQLEVPTEAVDTAQECVEGSSIVVTATPSREPVFDGNWLAPGTLVVAAGGNMWSRREIDETTIGRSEAIIVDEIATARAECGELMNAVERGVFKWEQANELRHVVAGWVDAQVSDTGVALFESQGLAVEDLAVAWHVWELAREAGVGTLLPTSTGG